MLCKVSQRGHQIILRLFGSVRVGPRESSRRACRASLVGPYYSGSRPWRAPTKSLLGQHRSTDHTPTVTLDKSKPMETILCINNIPSINPPWLSVHTVFHLMSIHFISIQVQGRGLGWAVLKSFWITHLLKLTDSFTETNSLVGL